MNRILARVLDWVQEKLSGIIRIEIMDNTSLTVVSRIEKDTHIFLVLYNGYDYEVKVFVEERLVHHSMGYVNLDEAYTFVEYYKKVLN